MSQQSPQNSFIEVRDLVKVYQTPAGGYTALKSLNVQVNSGEFVAVIGKSGSGKSTFINMLTGIDRPTSGEVWVGGTPLHKLDETGMAKWRGNNLGIVFQFFQLLPTLSLIQNVMLAMELNNRYPGKERHDRAMHLLEMVEMASHANKLPSAVSGGQQQRVAIARALANDPPMIVADEPTGSLDSKTADKIFGLFEKLVDSGKTILVVTHDDDQVKRATRTIVISDGEVVNEYLVQALKTLTQDQLVEVTRRVVPRVYQPATDIIRQGEVGDHLYIITSGKVDVFVTQANGSETRVNQLRQGQYFGEMALLGNGLRTATVRASADGDVSVSALDALAFNDVVEESSSLRTELSDLVEKRQVADQLEALSMLDRQWLAALTKDATTRTYPEGTVIIHQGAIGDTFYILLEGAVDVVKDTPNGVEQVINQLKAGQVFGELALIGNKRRTATVRVSRQGPAKVVELTAADFDRLGRESEQFRQVVARLRNERRVGTSSAHIPIGGATK